MGITRPAISGRPHRLTRDSARSGARRYAPHRSVIRVARLQILLSLATMAGSALWCSVLVWLGVTAGKDKLLLEGSLHRISLWGGGVLVFVWGLYYILVHRQMRRRGERRADP